MELAGPDRRAGGSFFKLEPEQIVELAPGSDDDVDARGRRSRHRDLPQVRVDRKLAARVELQGLLHPGFGQRHRARKGERKKERARQASFHELPPNRVKRSSTAEVLENVIKRRFPALEIRG
jgi:hypothetical protein